MNEELTNRMNALR